MAATAPAGGDAQFIAPIDTDGQTSKGPGTNTAAAPEAQAAPADNEAARPQDFIPAAVKAVLGCVIFCGSFVLTLCTGIALIAVASAAWTDDDACEAPVRASALTLGLLELGYWVAAIGVSCVNAFLQALARGTRPRILGIVNAAGVCVLFGVLCCRLGVLVWATVTAFGNSRWTRYLEESPDFTCNRRLYRSFAILIIVTWIAGAAFCLPMACMAPYAAYKQRQVLRQVQRERAAAAAVAAQQTTGAAASSTSGESAPIDVEAGAANTTTTSASVSVADQAADLAPATGGAAASEASTAAAPSDVSVAVVVASDRTLDKDAPNEPIDAPSPNSAPTAPAPAVAVPTA